MSRRHTNKNVCVSQMSRMDKQKIRQLIIKPRSSEIPERLLTTMIKNLVLQDAFLGVQNVDVERLSALNEKGLRPIMPCLVRMSLCSPLDGSDGWTLKRKIILKCLSGMEVVNNLVGLLSIDFHDLEQEAKKEQQLTASLGGNPKESLAISRLEQGLALEFERSDAVGKLKLLLFELMFVFSQIKEPRETFYEKSSELFDSEIYLEEVSDVLCIAQAELPHLLPMTEIAEALLHLSNGAWLLCRLVANNPDSLMDVCSKLVVSGLKQDEDSLDSVKRTEALVMLCDMCPSYLHTVRSMCIEHCRLPGLALTLTLRICRNENTHSDSISSAVVFVTSLLLDHNSAVRTWFSQFIRASDRKKDSQSSLFTMREKLLAELEETLLDLREKSFSDSQIVKGCAFIKLYGALRCMASLKFSDEENRALLQLVTLRPPPTVSGTRFISVGLCLLLACPHLMSTDKEEVVVASWLRWLIENGDTYKHQAGEKSSFSEMLLLIAIHFHGNQNNAISDLVSTTLGMKSSVKTSALTKMKSIFISQVFTEQVVAAMAVKVPVTENLNGKMTGFLPIHCIYQLLKSRAFSKHRVSISSWICKQLNQCSLPIHPIIPSLIEVYINSIILPHSKTDRSNEPIAEIDIRAVFDSLFDRMDDSSFATKLLYLYYTLSYQDVLLSNMAAIRASNRNVLCYSQPFINQLPIKRVLQAAQAQSSKLSGIYSRLLGLVATHHSHLCLVSDWLDCDELDFIGGSNGDSHDVLPSEDISCSPETLTESLKLLPLNSSLCVLLLEKISLLPADDLLPYCNILIDNLLIFLEEGIPRRCQNLVLVIWKKVNSVCSHLKLSTVNALRPADCINMFSLEEIISDPLIVLRCDSRVFRCPPFVEIILRTLNCFLQMSKSFFNNLIQMEPLVGDGRNPGASDREELRVTLVAAQESAAIQILLECCLPMNSKEAGNSDSLLSDMREVQCLICSHIHQKFISDTSLAKLIHFQGYPMRLIPVTVSGISSMYICVDFLPELIAQPQRSKLCFAIRLVSFLSLYYPNPRTLSIAELCLNVMNTMLSVLTSSDRPIFYVATLPDLVRFCTAFPLLCDGSVTLLFQLAQMVRVEMSDLSVFSSAKMFDDESKESDMTSDDTTDVEFGEEEMSKVQITPIMLMKCIFKTFNKIVGSTSLLKTKLIM